MFKPHNTILYEKKRRKSERRELVGLLAKICLLNRSRRGGQKANWKENKGVVVHVPRTSSSSKIYGNLVRDTFPKAMVLAATSSLLS